MGPPSPRGARRRCTPRFRRAAAPCGAGSRLAPSRVIRAALFIVALSGCLTAPPGAADDPGRAGDAGADPPPQPDDCVDGSTLDLVHVDRVAVAPWDTTEYLLDGIAVLANRGEQPVLLAELWASGPDDQPGLTAGVAISDGPLELPAGEAKGVLSAAAAEVVAPLLGASWTDRAHPSLAVDLLVPDADAFGAGDTVELPIEIHAGPYRFAVSLTLVLDGSGEPGLPLSAARATAPCP